MVNEKKRNIKKKIQPQAPVKTIYSTATTSGKSRPPVVTLMGHVDHGKTTLLDVIRQSKQTEKEFGGITQHIGAYQVTYKGRKITFIDTPGHAAFAKMRAHGAQVTDIVVLVIAANDGVKPQTREALSHIRAADATFLVAINKIDLPETNVERIKAQLAEESVVVESYGGETVVIEVSAKTGKNIDQLLEMILLLVDMKDLRAEPDGNFQAVVIETKQDKRRGISVTLLVKNGTLHLGDKLKLDSEVIRIRSMSDENGKPILQAGPSTPVEVFGFKKLPPVGQLIGVGSQPQAITDNKQTLSRVKKKALTKKEVEEEDDQNKKEEEEEEKQQISIILKADSLGTLEAITTNLSEEVEIVEKGIGEVTESDVLLAQATEAAVYAFNTPVSTSANKLAAIEGVNIKTYNIIYKLFEDLEKQVLKMLEPTIDEEKVGEAQIIAEFKIQGERVAGCKVLSGEINKTLPVHLKRGETIIADAKIKSLKKGKEDISIAKADHECGMTFKPRIDFKINDAIISYKILDTTE